MTEQLALANQVPNLVVPWSCTLTSRPARNKFFIVYKLPESWYFCYCSLNELRQWGRLGVLNSIGIYLQPKRLGQNQAVCQLARVLPLGWASHLPGLRGCGSPRTSLGNAWRAVLPSLCRLCYPDPRKFWCENEIEGSGKQKANVNLHLFRLHPTRGHPRCLWKGGWRKKRARGGMEREEPPPERHAQQRLGAPVSRAYLLPKGRRFHAAPFSPFGSMGVVFSFRWTYHLLHLYAWETVPVVKDGGS